MTAHYPELRNLGRLLGQDVVLDGEIVAVDEHGRPDFAALSMRRRPTGGKDSHRICFMAFDVLHDGTRSLLDHPLAHRRRVLEDLGLKGSHWCVPAHHVGEGNALFQATKAQGLEGVVAKRLDAACKPGIRSALPIPVPGVVGARHE